MTLLLVEDVEVNREVLTGLLEPASTGELEEAEECLRAARTDG